MVLTLNKLHPLQFSQLIPSILDERKAETETTTERSCKKQELGNIHSDAYPENDPV